MIPIVPGIIPKSAEEIRTLLKDKLTFSAEIHLDMVDGKFVPFTSWPFLPLGSPKEVRVETDKYTLEVDMMVSEPLAVAKEWVKSGADMLVFHLTSISLEDFSSFAQTTDISVSIAATCDTSLEELRPYIRIADAIQVMGIARVGAQGQPFDERVLQRIIYLKKEFPHHAITVDGSVNAGTIVRLKEAGASRFICGSAIVKTDNPQKAHSELQNLIN